MAGKWLTQLAGDIGGLMLVSTFREKFPQMDARTYPTLHVAYVD